MAETVSKEQPESQSSKELVRDLLVRVNQLAVVVVSLKSDPLVSNAAAQIIMAKGFAEQALTEHYGDRVERVKALKRVEVQYEYQRIDQVRNLVEQARQAAEVLVNGMVVAAQEGVDYQGMKALVMDLGEVRNHLVRARIWLREAQTRSFANEVTRN